MFSRAYFPQVRHQSWQQHDSNNTINMWDSTWDTLSYCNLRLAWYWQYQNVWQAPCLFKPSYLLLTRTTITLVFLHSPSNWPTKHLGSYPTAAAVNKLLKIGVPRWPIHTSLPPNPTVPSVSSYSRPHNGRFVAWKDLWRYHLDCKMGPPDPVINRVITPLRHPFIRPFI